MIIAQDYDSPLAATLQGEEGSAQVMVWLSWSESTVSMLGIILSICSLLLSLSDLEHQHDDDSLQLQCCSCWVPLTLSQSPRPAAVTGCSTLHLASLTPVSINCLGHWSLLRCFITTFKTIIHYYVSSTHTTRHSQYSATSLRNFLLILGKNHFFWMHRFS